VIVSDLEPEGAAAHGGVQVDDIIVALNNKPITSVHQLEANVFQMEPGTKVTVRVQRGADQMDVPIVTEEQAGSELDALADMVDPVQNVVPELGIVGINISKAVLKLMPDLRRPAGVVVAARQANAPYSGPALQVGDVVYGVNRQLVTSVAGLKQILQSLEPGSSAVLTLEREGEILYVPVEFD
jgi:serine protease Do